ncbi:S-adenosyl methyltransferase [Amycolatopsis pretoriensis]|uniref:S-adenosyl methyltransferase n=1 Tax=Amycolatopsis pretoriensis TaxID=218821 RepID=A0A1H5RID5_9PSEU|nr:SAM-dependent methyltransferase [Amycolatopsis pretoriensis]SEF38122.1 S-adenosyl methyltransferase [Amycolatopsis pretoriensis]
MTSTETTHQTPAPTARSEAGRAPWWWPCGVDQHRINLAYLYDAFREAKNSDNRFAPCVKFARAREREAADKLAVSIPDAGFVFRSEREFLDRAAAYLAAHQGVTSIVVAGAGLPNIVGTRDLHSIVRRREAATRNREQFTTRASVIYVERDPLVCAELRTLAHADSGVYVVDADPWDPTAMWDTLYNTGSENPGLVSPDYDRIGLLLGGVMSFHGGSRADVADVVQAHLAGLPVGAFLAMTHLFLPEHPDLAAQALEFAAALRDNVAGIGSLASEGEIEAMLRGTTLLPPGIVPAFTWYPDGPPTDPPVCGNFTAAVLAQKPGPDDDLPEPPWRPEVS